MASLAGMQPTPWYAVYGATKAFVLSFTEALAEELRGRVAVTAFCPGPVRTEIFRALQPGLTRQEKRYDLSAAEAARAAVDAAERRTVVTIPGAMNVATALVQRLLPRALVRRVSRGAAIRYIGMEPPA